MRKAPILLLLSFILFSCSNDKTDFNLSGKWVILDFKKNDVDLIDKLNKDIPSLSYYVNDKLTYPAIRFDDSIIVIPGNKNQRFKLKFQSDENLNKLNIQKLNHDTIPLFIQNSFLKNFDIKKNIKDKRLILKSGKEKMTIIKAEIFSKQINSRFMD